MYILLTDFTQIQTTQTQSHPQPSSSDWAYHRTTVSQSFPQLPPPKPQASNASPLAIPPHPGQNDAVKIVFAKAKPDCKPSPHQSRDKKVCAKKGEREGEEGVWNSLCCSFVKGRCRHYGNEITQIISLRCTLPG